MTRLVVENASAVMTCDPARPGLGLVEGASVVIEDGRVVGVGNLAGGERLDAGGGLVTPGLCDAHAHPIFAGDRAAEFALRAEGRGYLEIAAAGGGIASTVSATRAASDEELIALSLIHI